MLRVHGSVHSHLVFSNKIIAASFAAPAQVLAAVVKLTVVAGENLTVGSTVWLPAESVAPGR